MGPTYGENFSGELADELTRIESAPNSSEDVNAVSSQIKDTISSDNVENLNKISGITLNDEIPQSY